ncbi:MAG: ABC transporter ATP-binding protein [bacterium]|nr:ABC transporter ATP-binding protein [bacterium]
MTPLVQAEGLGKTYVDGPTEVQVLRGLDLLVAPGESVAIMGESGVGKSTLLHILGLLDAPNGGRLLFDGTDVLRLSESEQAALRNRAVGFVFQFHHLLPDFTALENVMLPALIGREPLRGARERAEALLARVGLGDRREHRPGEMSGGEQQRVAVARAMMRRPRLLLADEPTGSLDPATGERVQALMMELNAAAGSALVVATHNARLAATMGRTLRLVDGRLEESTAQVEGLRGTAGGV